MKKLCLQVAAVLLLCAVLLPFTGCLKDSATKRYTIYRPVYKTLAQVETEMKSNAAVAITEPGKMYIVGNTIYLNEKYKGVHIIDNSNPAAPVNKAFIPIPGNMDIAVQGNTLYADCYSYLFAIDITNPAQVVLTKTISKLFIDRTAVNGFLVDSTHIIYDWTQKDTTVEASVLMESLEKTNGFTTNCPFCMISLQSANSSATPAGQGGSMARFAIVNNYMYAVSTYQLSTLSLAQPQQPVVQNTIYIGGGIETIYPFQDKLFIGSQSSMMIYNIANPQLPVRMGAFAHANVCDPVITDGNYAYVTLRNGTACNSFTNQLDVVNVQNLMQPALVKSYPLTNPHGLSKDGQWLFICDGKDGLKCFDATNASSLLLKTTIPMAETYDVICYNKKAIVSAKDGLYQYDYNDMNNIKLLSKIGWYK